MRNQTPVIRTLKLYKTADQQWKENLVKVTSRGVTQYGSWHVFTKIRREFKQKFGCPLPGATDNYQGQVRAEFNFDQFCSDTCAKHLRWIMERTPLHITAPNGTTGRLLMSHNFAKENAQKVLRSVSES